MNGSVASRLMELYSAASGAEPKKQGMAGSEKHGEEMWLGD